MAAALIIIAIGGIMVYSSLTGTSITDALAGKGSDTKLDPSGKSYIPTLDVTGTDTSDPGATLAPSKDPIAGLKGSGFTTPAGGASGFKGPNAALLTQLASLAQNNYHLTITATTNGVHVPGSYHYQGRAFDAAGAEADMRAFAGYVQDNYQKYTLELIHNPGFAIKNYKKVTGPVVYAAVWAGHTTHVHVAM